MRIRQPQVKGSTLPSLAPTFSFKRVPEINQGLLFGNWSLFGHYFGAGRFFLPFGHRLATKLFSADHRLRTGVRHLEFPSRFRLSSWHRPAIAPRVMQCGVLGKGDLLQGD